MTSTPLGDYLRSRRADVTPADLGLPAGQGRRVGGLRREEVALVAGMSVDYYIRLEQGRERHPSAAVVGALGQALRLDHDGRAHLHRLAGLSPRFTYPPTDERVDPALSALMAMWPDNPAFVLGTAYDVLAGNALGEALFSGFPYSRNLIIKVFLDPGSRGFYADWPSAAANTVAGFRLAQGVWAGSPRIREVTDVLLCESPEFGEIWQRQDARGKTMTTKRFVHPDVGPLTLHMQSFDVRAAPGQELVVYSAEPDSSSAEALALLGSLAATRF